MSSGTHERNLIELTGLPTAAGREDRVIEWVERWARRRRWASLRRDRFGNLMLSREGGRSRDPIIFAAHMDHPAFVVTAVQRRLVEAEFRGGVMDQYFKATAVRLHHDDDRPRRGRITTLRPAADEHAFKRVKVEFTRAVDAEPGDVLTWDLPAATIRRGRLHAPACDDLAGVAAALSAFEALSHKRHTSGGDVRVLLTRAEEVGFIGAMAACRSGIIPKRARIVAIENSKSFADSPLGAGPIVRVGDRTSTFDPDLTYRAGQVALTLAERDPGFKWQRKLMPGGTCEASAYQAFGYTATCLCLPLGNYHNMNERTGRIAPEFIALNDFHGLVRLLTAVGRTLDADDAAAPLRRRLDALFTQRRDILR